jgi:cell wall-associated NlpC family hydrolase
MDRRLWPATTRVAHGSLRGQLEGVTFTEGEPFEVGASLVDLLRAPDGPRERQLPRGDGFTVIDRARGYVFGFATKDGYCGWLPEGCLSNRQVATHWVCSPGTHVYAAPKVQAASEVLPMGARVRVSGWTGKFAEVPGGFVPASHLRAIGDWLDDPVAVAEGLLGTPYLWGGNSRAGIDCSGLVQVAYAACGIGLPGDSDLQENAGHAVEGPLRRGDLIFWRGHVAMIVDEDRLIHANGFTMSVAYEGLMACIDRIGRAEGPVTAQRRVLSSLINRPDGSS